MPSLFGKSKRKRELEEVQDDWVGWLEPGVEVEGKMKVGPGLVRLNSHFKGEIAAEGTVVVHDQGEIEGEIQARIVSITGKVKGTIHASERLEIKEHGIVLGEIYTASLIIDPGGYFDGQCHMPAPEPEKQTTEGLDSKGHS